VALKPVTLAQVLVMAAIVATLFLVPAAGLVWVGCALLGISFESVVTLGNIVSAPAGLSAWWTISFVPAFAYAAFMLRD
jgi:hypothetical protein